MSGAEFNTVPFQYDNDKQQGCGNPADENRRAADEQSKQDRFQ